jgi:hypothetical protein
MQFASTGKRVFNYAIATQLRILESIVYALSQDEIGTDVFDLAYLVSRLAMQCDWA